MIGIYGIKNKVNGKIYIGQSVQIRKRKTRHFYELRHGKHRNQHLQKSFDQYGENNFEFITLQLCKQEELNDLEQKFIDEYKKVTEIYNLAEYVNDTKGYKNPFFGKKHKDSSKAEMSAWKKEHYVGENNPNYGKKNSPEVRKKMSLGRGILKENDVIKIVERLRNNESHASIAADYNISRTVITRISNGTRWANITGGPVFPVVYNNGKRVFQETHKNKLVEARWHKNKDEKTNNQDLT